MDRSGVVQCRTEVIHTTVFWNGLHKDIEELVSKCSTCQRHQTLQSKEQSLPRDVFLSAWHTIATDLFTGQQNTYLLVADPLFNKTGSVIRFAANVTITL